MNGHHKAMTNWQVDLESLSGKVEQTFENFWPIYRSMPSGVRLEFERLVREKKASREAMLRARVRHAAASQRITPEAVCAYAELLLQDELGNPIKPAPHHVLWIRLMCDERIKQLLIVAPPESAKTTWAISAFCGLHIGVFPEYPIILGSVTGDVAELRALSLRAMVDTPDWQACFPDIKPVRGSKGLKWESMQWSVAPFGVPYPGRIHPTVAAAGTQGTVIGGRARLVIGDDLLDYDSTRTAFQRDATHQWAHNSFFSRSVAQIGRKILIGNAWHHDDLYARAQDPKSGWVVCHIPILSATNKVYATLTFPDNWNYNVIGEAWDTDNPYAELAEVT
jgi:hypothetical protein